MNLIVVGGRCGAVADDAWPTADRHSSWRSSVSSSRPDDRAAIVNLVVDSDQRELPNEIVGCCWPSDLRIATVLSVKSNEKLSNNWYYWYTKIISSLT